MLTAHYPRPGADNVSGTTLVTVLKLLGVTLLWGLALLSSGAQANSPSPDEGLIERRVKDFLAERTRDLGRDITIRVHPGSARLPRCEAPQPFLTRPDQRLHGRVSVGVRCGNATGPVRYLQAEVSVLVDHVVAARDIAPGATITAQDIELAEGRLERLPRHALLDRDEALGLTAARPLRTGSLLQSHHLRRERLVERGDVVTVVARGGGFSVKREAKALDNGALGDSVRLRIASGDQLRATVTGPDRLEIPF
ncbi:flagella basal body P-ring formation protein FlgA [Modicisalibacter ilicicola DSM 19980]|uniref:Flagella basal body P-ring formation protein FlgA n=1 Tax=Modicisalibacter ilicicola DSM 19980 TaxID=1121942 RepID=A0A1M4Z1H8_9GAMM|nr:flagellar basal body P-ring formation chaperone FlgA [Halomonas ilicicola]SHF11657.1 flagella basal body P-ring formation protein FlgA [Halomonas ilicicola DSM 19980]